MAERRATRDRRTTRRDRRARDRKRNADNRIAVIELAETELRVAILQRGATETADQVDALTVTWRQEATSPNTDQGRTELAAALKSLVESHALPGCQDGRGWHLPPGLLTGPGPLPRAILARIFCTATCWQTSSEGPVAPLG